MWVGWRCSTARKTGKTEFVICTGQPKPQNRQQTDGGRRRGGRKSIIIVVISNNNNNNNVATRNLDQASVETMRPYRQHVLKQPVLYRSFVVKEVQLIYSIKSGKTYTNNMRVGYVSFGDPA